MDFERIKQRVDEVNWFHSYEIVPGIMSHGVSNMLERGALFPIPDDLSGKRVLDIGCNDGYFTFLAEERGAEVVAIDSWPRRGFFLAHELKGSKAEFHQMSVYDISPERLGMFDIVFFFGVYYHLKKPIKALEQIAKVTKEVLLVESEIATSPEFDSSNLSVFYSQDQLGGDPTNWWVPSIPNLVQTVKAAGFPKVEFVSSYDQTRGIVQAFKGPRTSGKILNEDLFIAIDSPLQNQVVEQTVTVAGWALSQLNHDKGIKRIVVYLDELDEPASELGEAEYRQRRPDLTLPFGKKYGSVGFKFSWNTKGVPPGQHTLYIFAEGQEGWHYRSVPVIVKEQQSVNREQVLALKQKIQEGEEEIARLQNLVDAYERGKFMRATRKLHHFWQNSPLSSNFKF
jgi:tRNA (mo5U34)-methyltransferase